MEPIKRVVMHTHHIEAFTDFLFYGDKEHYFELERDDGYSGAWIENQKSVYSSIQTDPGLTVHVTFKVPDSICLPEACDKCNDCLNSDITKAIQGNYFPKRELTETYIKFFEVIYKLRDVGALMHYEGLEPNKDYSSAKLMEIVKDTGEKIIRLLKSKNRPIRRIGPTELRYGMYSNDRISEYFPLASRFEESELQKKFIERSATDFVSKADKTITDDEIEALFEEFPGLLPINEGFYYTVLGYI